MFIIIFYYNDLAKSLSVVALSKTNISMTSIADSPNTNSNHKAQNLFGKTK